MEGNCIAEICLKAFGSWPKSKKPRPGEWTVLAGVVQTDRTQGAKSEAVALGTGCKCVGAKSLTPEGHLISDGHAEVMARRGFLLYLHSQAHLCLDKRPSIFTFADDKFKLSQYVHFHFFSTKSPCGLKLFADCEAKRDFSRKPGKGDPSLSASCTDKLFRWLNVGVQGALLDMLFKEPVSFKSVVVGGDGAVDLELLQRNLSLPSNSISILRSELPFQYAQTPKSTPSYCSIVWAKIDKRAMEVSVEGYKLGATKKNRNRCLLEISKKKLFVKFLELYNKIRKLDKDAESDVPYRIFKRKSRRYYNSWEEIKSRFYNCWPIKESDLLNFNAL